MSVSGTPGTGAVTLNAATAGYQSFATVGVPNQAQVTVLFLDAGNAWELSDCIYTASGTSLARTLKSSSTGSLLSLTSAATASIVDSSADIISMAYLYAQSFGSGADGNVTISGAVSLVRDMNYNNLTITSGAAVSANGCRIYVAGNLDESAAPAGWLVNNGNNGSAATALNPGGAGAVATPRGTMAVSGSVGAVGAIQLATSQAPEAGIVGGLSLPCAGGLGGVTATGGIAGSGTKVPGAGASPASVTNPTPNLLGWLASPHGLFPPSASPTVMTGVGEAGSGGCSGGAGAGDSVANVVGSAGGGGGGGGGLIWIAAATITRGPSTAAAGIQAKGGAAGAGKAQTTGNAGGAAGSSGGGGGCVVIIYGALVGSTAANNIDVTGGTGAAGTAAAGTGTPGAGGPSGQGGTVYLFNLATGALTYTGPVASVAGGAISGSTPGTGATATTSQISL